MTHFFDRPLPSEWQTVRRSAAHSMRAGARRFNRWLQVHGYRLLLLALLVFVLLKKDLTLELRLSNHWSAPSPTNPQAAALTANSSAPEAATPLARQLAYVEHYADLARREMTASGIPASIKLAQALLETNAGQSELATRFRNHFGIKCFSKECRRGHCSNFSDDSHKDFFRIYASAEESYRNHSQLLQSERYRRLFKLSPTDYRGWAKGLQRAGYATDRQYADKLIRVIERLNLQQFDS